jgi:hypothetical protein
VWRSTSIAKLGNTFDFLGVDRRILRGAEILRQVKKVMQRG